MEVTPGEAFQKEIHKKYGKFETFAFLKGNFVQVSNRKNHNISKKTFQKSLETAHKHNRMLIVYVHLDQAFFNDMELQILKHKPLIEFVVEEKNV